MTSITQPLSASTGIQLSKSDLLHALSDPSLGSIGFLNEIMDRFPNAISFAPGAPFPGFFDDLDISVYVDLYIEYLSKQKNMTMTQIRRHLYQYGPSRGQINDLLATALQIDEAIDVSGDAIVVTVGCQEAMVLALRALCSRSTDILAIVNPCFAGIAGAAKVLGIEVVAIDDAGSGFAVNALSEACANARKKGQRIRALYIAPDYSNPSGTLIDLDMRHQLLNTAEQEDFLVLEDNAYGFTALAEQALPTLKSLDRSKRVIYLGTCAKICLPGVRVGFVVADQIVVNADGNQGLLAEELSMIKSMLTVNTSPICQAIIGGMLLENNGSLKAIGREKASLYQKNLFYLLDALDRHISPALLNAGVMWNRPKGGFFVVMRLPILADEALLHLCASEYGVLWTPMKNFYINDGGKCELRLSCSYLTLDEIEEGILRLSHFLEHSRVLQVD